MDDQTANFNREVRDIWNHNAVFWDEFMADGNDFHRVLISPSVIRLRPME